MPTSPASASNTRRQRSTRSVTGCLTCRRRKVKCTSRATPCEPCRRLGLSCDSSFGKNFKSWTGKNDGRETASLTQIARELAANSSSERQGSLDEPEGIAAAGSGQGIAAVIADDGPKDDSHLGIPDKDPSFSLLDFIFSDLATEITPMDFNQSNTSDSLYNMDWTISETNNTQGGTGERNSNTSLIQSQVGRSAHAGQHTDMNLPQASLTDQTMSNTMFRVPEWLSTKKSIWTCFHYLVNSARAVPNSPLCHAILGWAYAYLSQLNAGPDASRAEHYGTASAAIRILSQELSGNTVTSQSLWNGTNPTDLLSLYVSSTFFLCQHDLMTGDFGTFMDRLQDAKLVFQRMWAEGTTPGPIESRIVIWLAFLELRFYFLGGGMFVQSTAEKDFMTILMELKALPLLRRIRTQTSILSECFGNGLPQEENEEDLRKDRCRGKFDDLMFYLAKCRSFEAWDDKFREQLKTGDYLAQELRQAKIEVLEADMKRLQAECELAFPSSQPNATKHVAIASDTFHKLTVDALRSCIYIAFKRTVDPDATMDSDPQSQAAVSDIVRIARLLRNTKFLRSPRSTIWPLPLFIAGIEATDGVYQDWIVQYMKELKPWGSHVERSTEVLERIITQQEATGHRMRLAEITKNLNNHTILV